MGAGYDGTSVHNLSCKRAPVLSNAKIVIAPKLNMHGTDDSSHALNLEEDGQGIIKDYLSLRARASSSTQVTQPHQDERSGTEVAAGPTFENGTWRDATDYSRDGVCLSVSSSSNLLQIESEESTSMHCEAETRFVWALYRLILPHGKHGHLIVSDDSDVMAILAMRKLAMRGRGVVHVMSGRSYSLDRFWFVLEKACIESDAAVLRYICAGCDFVPGTKGVSPVAYAKALVEGCGLIEGQYELGHGTFSLSNLSDTCPLIAFESMIGLAYAVAHSSDLTAVLASLKSQSAAPASFSDDTWPMAVRRWLMTLDKLKCVSLFMALNPDVNLHRLQTLWVCSYWLQ